MFIKSRRNVHQEFITVCQMDQHWNRIDLRGFNIVAANELAVDSRKWNE